MTQITATDLLRLTANWPGKSKPSEHPALWHMLDVGAVAQSILHRQPMETPALSAAFAALVALHDLGKISASFRAMLRDGAGQHFYHWQHTATLLTEMDDLLAQHLGGEAEVRRILVEALSGHHGGPREKPTADRSEQQRRTIGTEALIDAEQALIAVLSCFPDASLAGVTERQAVTLSWHLNGLVVQSDWIGSNPDWFPPAPPDVPLADYWPQTQARAEQGIKAAGLFSSQPSAGDPSAVLGGLAARPMQVAAAEEDLPDGPVLTIVEDSTGAGKTEAALILAARMMQAGKGAGVFFALPTMATANAMLSRLEAASRVLFDGAPTLALSHGRARLSKAFQRIKGRDASNPEAGPHCGSWLSDDRRRILLADLGVGTIDQALFGVLPTRFNGLRLRALSQRILVVDEAHDYDPYMQAQLERLLQMQARLGGSAIVMTATLPGPKKAAFEAAFKQGLSTKPRRASSVSRDTKAPGPEAPYPVLTTVAGVAKGTKLTAVNSATERAVALNRLAAAEDAVALICTAQAKGAACIWIRNAVDDAIAAVEALRAAGVEADLLHARFALCDRLDKEAALQNRFGRNSTPEDRRGRVLVVTQVAEQSLDLDFDVMVSDLAPIGAMIQRAGRLWRHDRPESPGRPVPGPVLHVLSPDPDVVQNDRWLHQVLGAGAYVYDPTVTWRSARALFDADALVSPIGLRPLIEAVEGQDPLPLPEALQQAEFALEGQDIIERSMARNVLIAANEAFDQDNMAKVWDDEHYPTRLGVPQVTLALATRPPAGLRPLAEDEIDPWALSEVQVSAKRFEGITLPQDTAEIAEVKAGWSEARAKHTLIAVLDAAGHITDSLKYDRDLGIVWLT